MKIEVRVIDLPIPGPENATAERMTIDRPEDLPGAARDMGQRVLNFVHHIKSGCLHNAAEPHVCPPWSSNAGN